MALVTIRRSSSVQSPRKTDETEKSSDSPEDDIENRVSKSLNECYFANKGAAVVLGASERGCDRRRTPLPPVAAAAHAHTPPCQQSDIQHHLQAMFYLLRPEETLKMAVKLESAHAGRTRYLVVVCHGDEAALLGIDCNERTTIGLVLRVLADTSIQLDGDGGFSMCVCSQQHIFKPVSVQAMWSALQTLHRASGRARSLNHFAGGTSHAWCLFYESRIDSDRSCLNEWHAMDSIESRRPPSPDSLRHKPRQREETERVIRSTLKEIMMCVDLDEVTSKAIRGRLEDELDMDLAEYKSFIDHEMITILGQMDAPTEIFDHVYLGSEWNASNLEELQRNGVRHILNVTREIDNFFPGMFDYLNIRVYDDDKTDLLKHWDDTFKYINKARNEGSKVLVHCKMGISRSASVVIAYAMKAYNWHFDKALKHVKTKRSCIKPNTNFLNQLETYQGILDAMKNKEKLQRSKSETNLKSPKTAAKAENKIIDPTPLALALTGSYTGRPRSWSPDTKLASEMLPPTSVSLENLVLETRHMLMPCANGSYSVSPNQIIRLKEEGALSVKHIVNEIENAACSKELNKRYQKLCYPDSLSTRSLEGSVCSTVVTTETLGKPPQVSPLRNSIHKYPHSIVEADRIHTWDPGETVAAVAQCRVEDKQNTCNSDNIVKSDSGIVDVKTTVKTNSEGLSSSVDRISDCEDKKTMEEEAPPASRQSSWSSFDSAVVPDLSRHSSWGSYDTRVGGRPQPALHDDPTKHVKETADESVCVRKDDEKADDTASAASRATADLGIITEHSEPRAVFSAIADNERKFNETCAILKELASAASRMESVRDRGASTWGGRLSTSAPADTWRRTGLRRRRLTCASHGDLPRAARAYPANLAHPTSPHSPAGLVSNLKKEFEARSENEVGRRVDSRSRARESKDRLAATPPGAAGDDLSVKVLVDRYDQPSKPKAELNVEAGRRAHELNFKKSKLGAEGEGCAQSRTIMRNSFCGAVRGLSERERERPPIAPTVVAMPIDFHNGLVSTVISKAQNKKQLQHGKTHPLTRLNRSSNRCSNAVYNTM